jgi:hypothetical protein
MARINIESTQDEYLIRIDKTLVDKTYVHELLNLLQVEELAQRVDFDDSIIDLGEEIKTDWWKKNKARFISDAS